MNGNNPSVGHHEIVEKLWQDQERWSKTASRLKKELIKWRLYATIAGITGAILETLAGTLTALNPDLRIPAGVIAIIGAVILSTIPFITINKLSKERIGNWIRSRSVSEALKELIYKFLIKVTYSGSATALQEFIEETDNVKEKVKDLTIYCADIEPVRKDRPLDLTINDYVIKRVDDQIEKYYRKNGKIKALAAKRLHGIEFGFGLFAVILGAVAGFHTFFKSFSFFSPWVAVITTMAGAITAHLAAMRYDHEAIIYFCTADRLSSLKIKWLANPDKIKSDVILKFVDDCEHAISTENESWLAKWTEVPATNMTNTR